VTLREFLVLIPVNETVIKDDSKHNIIDFVLNRIESHHKLRFDDHCCKFFLVFTGSKSRSTSEVAFDNLKMRSTSRMCFRVVFYLSTSRACFRPCITRKHWSNESRRAGETSKQLEERARQDGDTETASSSQQHDWLQLPRNGNAENYLLRETKYQFEFNNCADVTRVESSSQAERI